jgi:DNA-binding NarL/FixJ family response regulator
LTVDEPIAAAITAARASIVFGGCGEREVRDSPSPLERLSEVPANRRRILVVEDEYLLSAMIEDALVQAGHEVVGVARSASEAIEIALSRRPALVIMDIRLHGPRDGIDAAIEILQHTGVRSLFASAHADDGTRRRAAAARPHGWVAKPYRADDLLRAVAAVILSEEQK